MEYSLGSGSLKKGKMYLYVLILILMEYSLGDRKRKQLEAELAS